MLLLLLGPATVWAEPVAVRALARLRTAPGKTARLIDSLPAGTPVEVVSEGSGGWVEVRTTDGRTGFIWGEHLGDRTAAVAPPAEVAPTLTAALTPATTPPPPASATLSDEVRALRADVAAMRERVAATPGDVERIRLEVSSLAEATRDIGRRLSERPSGPFTAAPSSAPSPLLSWALLGLGALVGFGVGRLTPRRERRQRGRLKL